MSYSFTNANIIGMPESHRAVIGIDMSPDVWLEAASNADDPVAMLRPKGEWQVVLADALEDLKQSAGPNATPVTDPEHLSFLEDYPPGTMICELGWRVRRWKLRDARQSNDPIETLREIDDNPDKRGGEFFVCSPVGGSNQMDREPHLLSAVRNHTDDIPRPRTR